MHTYLSTRAQRLLPLAIAAALSSQNVLADTYTWSVPNSSSVTLDTQNGQSANAVITAINNAGLIAGQFVYDSSISVLPGSDFAPTTYYKTSCAGPHGHITCNTSTTLSTSYPLSGATLGFYGPSLVNNLVGALGQGVNIPNTSVFNNLVSGINNNGYVVEQYANGSYVTNTPTTGTLGGAPTSGTLLSDSNQNIFGAGTYVNSTTALGLSDGSNGSFGVVVGTNTVVDPNNIVSSSGGFVDSFIYNNTSKTLDGIAPGAYGDFMPFGSTNSQFDGAAEVTKGALAGDLLITGSYQDGVGDTISFIYNATTNTYTQVIDPLAAIPVSAGNTLAGVTVLTGLNSIGEAVGYFEDPNFGSVYHGFTYNYETHAFISSQIDANIPNIAQIPTSAYGYPIGTILNGVNNSGTVVGTVFADMSGNNYIGIQGITTNASAVPLPSAAWMMLGGLFSGLGLMRKRRN